MSLLNEYLKLIPKALGEPKLVLSGWINDAKIRNKTISEENLKTILDRRLICATCPFMSKNSNTSKEYLELTGKHYESERKTEHCSFCGCPTTKLSASLEDSCGIEHWNEENPDKLLELKWKSITKQ
jgi:hypothetical protein